MTHYDAIIVGGSYAGLSAALALGRSLKRVLVVDSGQPCNRQTPNSHNFLTRDGETPQNLSRIAREQLAKYETIEILDAEAQSARAVESGFELAISDGHVARSSKLVLATGIRDQIPEIPGLAERWGISVVHCPYCHGFEHRGGRTGILAPPDKIVHLASLLKSLTDEIVAIPFGPQRMSREQGDLLAAHNIPVLDGQLAEVHGQGGVLSGIQFRDGRYLQLDVLYAGFPFAQHSHLPELLGCEMTDAGHIKVDGFGRTTVPGVFACGDNSSPMRSVANAVATGNQVGSMVNRELTSERFVIPPSV